MSDGAWDGNTNGPKNRVRDSVGYNSETQYVLEKRISALEAENQRLKAELVNLSIEIAESLGTQQRLRD